ncbi:ArsR family transcriptional regulator [Longibacter salinarum]|uniref:ArsR family transcriptional regulator n=1 Tax=Longibacter salinarum TaxID=1850348 RepID=A0A2A8CYR0_9BACT|nr:Lrp/AsnC family transcriptional regulator [Longibacter salinarum]PEN13869.1 ArsR family transcriptional regulator [Longibacter salinarum]
MARLDRTDFEIIREMQKNARIQNKALARRVGIAESTCLERVRKLRDDGILTGFYADVDAASVGVHLQALIALQLSKHSRETVERVREHVARRPEVVAIYHLGGRTDFLLHVAVRDADHLRDLILSAFTSHDEVAQVETSLIFDHSRADAWPIYPPEAR